MGKRNLRSLGVAVAGGTVSLLHTAEGRCLDSKEYLGYDVLPTINRQVFSSIASEHLCNAICKRDPGCYATVWNSTTKRCYTKAEDGMDRIKSRSDYILSSCSDPRPDPPVCEDVRRFVGYDVSFKMDLQTFFNIPDEQACIDLCLAYEECFSAVYIAVSDKCFLKAAGVSERFGSGPGGPMKALTVLGCTHGASGPNPPTEPTDPAEPVQPVRPVRPGRPTRPTRPVGPSRPTRPAPAPVPAPAPTGPAPAPVPAPTEPAPAPIPAPGPAKPVGPAEPAPTPTAPREPARPPPGPNTGSPVGGRPPSGKPPSGQPPSEVERPPSCQAYDDCPGKLKCTEGECQPECNDSVRCLEGMVCEENQCRIPACTEFEIYPSADVTPGVFRESASDLTDYECVDKCVQDINCRSAVTTLDGKCFTKSTGPSELVRSAPEGQVSQLTLLRCLTPRPQPPPSACDGVSTRYPGYNIQPGSILESIPHVQYEEECLNYCVVEPACKSAVHLSGTQTCHLKRVAPAVPRNLNDPNLVGGTLERFVSLVCAEPQFTTSVQVTAVAGLVG